MSLMQETVLVSRRRRIEQSASALLYKPTIEAARTPGAIIGRREGEKCEEAKRQSSAQINLD